MFSSNWDHSSRIIPTQYDHGFWRPSRWEVAPFQREFTREYAAPPPEFSSSLSTYPVRERGSNEFEREMRRMNDEMGKMFNSLQKSQSHPQPHSTQLQPHSTQLQLQSQPMPSVDDWRLTENFRMENPIQTYNDGSRKFHLQFDMRQFKPEEIHVKTSGNTLTVSAKHDEKDPSKSVYREYNRSYVIPKGVNAEMLTSKLGTDGTLTIEAPLPALEGPREKLIPIKHN